jgi:hypothetical protein
VDESSNPIHMHTDGQNIVEPVEISEQGRVENTTLERNHSKRKQI